MFNWDIKKNNDLILGCNKVSHCFPDGLGLLLKQLCASIADDVFFFVLFDETTNFQNKKQMDLLVRYWYEEKGEVIAAYVTSLIFGCCRHEELWDKFIALQVDPILLKLPWGKFINIYNVSEEI